MSRHWMPLYIGDYRVDTMHLDQAQHGAYILLLMHCWKTQQALPNDLNACYRIASALTPVEQENVRMILGEFFEVTEDGFENPKIREVIEEQNRKTLAARENGAKGGRPKEKNKKPKQNPTQKLNETQHITQAVTETVTQSKAKQKLPEPEPDINNITTTTTTEKIDGSRSGCNFKIINRGIETTEDEWIFRCFLERRRSKNLSVHGCDNLSTLLSLYPTHLEQYRRWQTLPDEIRMAAYAYTMLQAQAEDPMKYAQHVADNGRTWDNFQPYLETARKAVEKKDYVVKI